MAVCVTKKGLEWLCAIFEGLAIGVAALEGLLRPEPRQIELQFRLCVKLVGFYTAMASTLAAGQQQ